MDQKRDYYEVLGVDRDADDKTIKRAFLKKARTLHPDVNKEAGAEEAFKEAGVTLYTLTDYEHVISEAAETGYVTEADLELLREWRKNPAEWGK